MDDTITYGCARVSEPETIANLVAPPFIPTPTRVLKGGASFMRYGVRLVMIIVGRLLTWMVNGDAIEVNDPIAV